MLAEAHPLGLAALGGDLGNELGGPAELEVLEGRVRQVAPVEVVLVARRRADEAAAQVLVEADDLAAQRQRVLLLLLS